MSWKNIIIIFVIAGMFGVIADLFVFDHWKMNGHWHMYRFVDTLSYEREFITIDYEDKYGTVNRNIEISYPLGYYMNSLDKTSEISAECYQQEFTYRINHDSLILIGDDNMEVYKGYKCRSNCCDKQFDYFSAVPFSLSLDEDCSDELIPREGVYPGNCIFLSASDLNNVKIGYGVFELKDLEKWVGQIENTYSYESSRDHRIILYADKESSQLTLEHIKQSLCRFGVETIYFGYKCESTESSFKVMLKEIFLKCGNAANNAPPSTPL